jgi:hydrophobic/amphiphilic exporter-1 (mainly G- bacteria), HAE1 family
LGGMTKGAFIAFPGFSVNTLTLFGLVLAVGIIVDDAIVLSLSSKPYVHHHLEHGLSPREATVKAVGHHDRAHSLRRVCACGFHGRSHWTAYQQFAITVAVAVVFSAVNGLTLSPLEREKARASA